MMWLAPETKCLSCSKKLDAVSAPLSGRKPEHGDVSVCLYCGHVMAFNADLTLRPLTDAEMQAVAGDKRLLEIQAASGKVMKK